MNKEFYNAKGERIGILSNGVYYSNRTSSIHFCRVAQGYPITSKTLEELKKLDCKTICIKEQTLKDLNVWVCDFDKYYNGKEFQLGGFEPQKCCPLKEMRLETQKQL